MACSARHEVSRCSIPINRDRLSGHLTLILCTYHRYKGQSRVLGTARMPRRITQPPRIAGLLTKMVVGIKIS